MCIRDRFPSLRLLLVAGFNVDEAHIHGADFALCVIAKVDGIVACLLYTSKTRSQLMKLAAEPGEDAQAQALDAVTVYTQTFNKMGFIETEERDEIYMALRGILDALPGDALQKDTLIEKFDELRDF